MSNQPVIHAPSGTPSSHRRRRAFASLAAVGLAVASFGTLGAAPASSAAQVCGGTLADWQTVGIPSSYNGVLSYGDSKYPVSVTLLADHANTLVFGNLSNFTSLNRKVSVRDFGGPALFWENEQRTVQYLMRSPECANGGTRVTSARLGVGPLGHQAAGKVQRSL
ncbi:hypothetical protein [Streptomyces sp. YIM 121038]|uniref:hypothetical protein n=1 Tax=Streptomyces sp. YIM 121038 TaxID=2136401 RepID=UPI001110A9F0|nr:hypothetical protein [Streptomyces sp. YIM 121038]